MFVEQTLDSRIEAALPVLARLQQENRMKEADIFESWAERLTEGTWSLPETPEQQQRLQDLMSRELIVGPDATNATEQLDDLVGDDILFDRLSDLASRDASANVWDDTDVQARLAELGIQLPAEAPADPAAAATAEPAVDPAAQPVQQPPVTEAATPASVSKVLRLIERHKPEWFDDYGIGEVEDAVVDMAEQGQFQGMSAQDAINLVAQELESMYGPQGIAEGSLDDIEDTKQFRDAVALAKTQKAIRQAKYGKDTKFYADGTPATPKEVARRAAERKARQQGVAEGSEELHPDTLELIDEYIAKIEPDADRDELIQSVLNNHIHTSELEYALQGLAETALKDKEDLAAKRRALQDLSRNPGVDQKAVQQRQSDLEKEAKSRDLVESLLDEFVEGLDGDELAEDAVDDFLARGGEIQQGKFRKPRKSEKTDYGSRHIGTLGGGGKPSKVSGTAANTRVGAKPVVAVEASGCNHTMEGEMCPEHGLAECGMHESQVQESDDQLARLKSLALGR
jgi:hypothetical protein